MKPINKLFSVILLALLLCSILASFSISASASSVYNVECKNSKRAEAIYFYSYDAKTVMFSKNENKIIAPASTVKIMTGLISCELLSECLSDRITVTEEMLDGCGGVIMGLKVGDSLSIEDILYGAICGGYNDACQVLAVICGGSLESFVEDMNDHAVELGMSSTVYKNPTGLDENGAKTTAFDVAILSKAAVKNSLYMKISSAKNYSYKKPNGNDGVIYNKNALISHFTSTEYLNDHASGLIAGSTEQGGYVVSTLAVKDGMSYLCIVMGADYEDGTAYSYKIANELINDAFSKFSRTKIISKGEEISTLPIDCALTTEKDISVACVVDDDIFAFLPKDANLKKKLEYKVYYHNTDLNAPINEGDVLGGINVYFNGEYVGSAKLISADTVEENSFLVFMKDMRRFLLSRYFLIFLFIALPSVAVFLYFDFKHRRRSKVKYIDFR